MRRESRFKPRQERRFWVIIAVIALVGSVAGIGAAVAGVNPGDPDVLALAARIPNDQGPQPCPPAGSGKPSPTGGHQHRDAGAPADNNAADDNAAQDAGAGADSAAPDNAAPDAGSAAANSRNRPSSSPTGRPGQPPAGKPTGKPSATGKPSPSQSGDCHNQDQGGPSPTDFVDIRAVKPNVNAPRPGRNASKGTFVSDCGRNANQHRNPDNFIVAPGVNNGAHHTHDYVGNLSTNGFSTDNSLAAAGTTCKQKADQSAYYWPVLRYQSRAGADANQPGGGKDGNIGRILQPSTVTLQFRGNAKSKVRSMPRFLRVITGDAKALTNGPANAKAAWTCTGFENRTTTKYPICPRGSKVERILDFASCWDGKNTDSANHRAHIVFPKADGSCWNKTVAVPQLRMTLTYDVPPNSMIAVDTFPEQKHNPITDHADFENVMSDQLMGQVVNCLNSGRQC